jgi:hypothetical protein
MATDASAVLGAPQLAGSFVNPSGYGRRMTATVAGGLIGGAIAAKTAPKQEDVPEFGRVGFVAVTADEIALIKTKSGLLKMKLTDQVLARRPRSEIASAELDRGKLNSVLKIQFADGGLWAFDVPKVNQGSATQVVQVLGGAIT